MDILQYINSFKIGTFEVQFYAFCLLGGGLIALWVSNYRAHKKGYPMDIFDTMFLWAFPGGVIGGRIWYIIATWNQEPWTFERMLGITSTGIKLSGLAIQGGVIGGVLVGVLFALIRRKGLDVFEAADYIVPTILIAQAIGRWGNFFNQEVYGMSVNQAAYWFLPDFINQNMLINGYYKVPLFLIEGVINIGGYFLLTRFVPLCFGKHYQKGDMLCLYLTWYGAVRALLEPLRDPAFNMGGSDSIAAMKAVSMSIAFIVVGILGVVANHVVRHYLAQRSLKAD